MSAIREYSPTLHRMVNLTPAMLHLLRALRKHGNVDPIRDGRKTGTIVALMERGFIRECRGRAGIHRPATTPEMVYAEALDEHARWEMQEAASEQATPRYRRFGAAVIEGKSYRAALDILHAEALAERFDRLAEEIWTGPLFTESIRSPEVSGRWAGATNAQRAGLLALAHDQALNEDATRRATTPAVSSAQVAVANEVAALRAMIAEVPGELLRGQMLVRLDRIAALAPRRATVPGEGDLWMHDCGAIATGGRPRGYDCYGCRSMQDWRELLYTVAGR